MSIFDSEKNFEKRDAFYKKLCKISFDCNPQTIILKDFKDEMHKSLEKLITLCSETLKQVKGSATSKYISLMLD